MKNRIIFAAASAGFVLIAGSLSAGELENFKSGKTVSNGGLPGEAEIVGTGIANGTAEPASSDSFPCGGCGFGPGSPDITTNKTYPNAGAVIEFDDAE